MRIIAGMKVFNGGALVEPVVRQVMPYVDGLVAAVSDRSWNAPDIEPDGTADILHQLAEEYGPRKIEVLHGSWSKESDHVNSILNYIRSQVGSEPAYYFYLDADESYTNGHLEFLTSAVRDDFSNSRPINAYYVKRHCYFRTLRHRTSPMEMQDTLIVFRILPLTRFPEGNSCRDVNTAGPRRKLAPDDCVMHHFSYVRSSHKEIYDKIRSFSHADEIIGGADFWFNYIWKTWTPQHRSFHPTHPSVFQAVNEIPVSELPEQFQDTELVEWFDGALK